MDLVEVVTETSVYHSFLSVGYGLIADMDIESERLRCLGGLRFALWAIIRTIGKLTKVQMHCFICSNNVTLALCVGTDIFYYHLCLFVFLLIQLFAGTNVS